MTEKQLRAILEIKEAIDFFNRVKNSSEDEKFAVGIDHWNWLVSASEKLNNVFDKERLNVS